MVVGSAFGVPQIFAPNRSETLQNKGFVVRKQLPENCFFAVFEGFFCALEMSRKSLTAVIVL